MKLQNKRICVTGGAGFIGSHLCRKLLKMNNKVGIVDNFSTGSSDNLKGIEKQLEIVRADIRDQNAIEHILRKSDIVYHLAAISSPKKCQEDLNLALEVNVEGATNVLSCCLDSQRVIFPSSITVYGSPKYVPIDEQQPPEPGDLYSITKLTDEYLVKMYSRRYGFSFTILRLCNTYGPCQGADFLIPALIRQGLTESQIKIWDPNPVRDFVFVEDVISAFVKAIEAEPAKNEIFNIGSGQGFSAGRIADLISNFLGTTWLDVHKPQLVSPKLIAHTGKFRAFAEWKSKTCIENGLRTTVEYSKKLIRGGKRR